MGVVEPLRRLLGGSAAACLGLLLAALLACASVARAEVLARLTDLGIDRSELAIRVLPLSEPELAELAGRWFAILQDSAVRDVDLQVALVESADRPAARHALNQQIALRNGLMRNFMEVVRAWEQKGGDPAMVARYHAYRNAVVIGGTRAGDLPATMSRILLWLGSWSGGGRLALRAGIILLQFAALFLLAGLCARAMRRAVAGSAHLSQVLRNFLVIAARRGVLLGGAVMILSLAGMGAAPFYALVAGSSIIAALAFQESLSNVAAGVMIMLARPFDEGDLIELAGASGRVRSAGIVATVVVTPDNRTVLIPNRQVCSNVIVSKSMVPIRRMDMSFRFSSYDMTEKARDVAPACLSRDPRVLDEPPPVVRLTASQRRGIGLLGRPWTRKQDYGALKAELNSQLVAAFGGAGLTLVALVAEE